MKPDVETMLSQAQQNLSANFNGENQNQNTKNMRTQKFGFKAHNDSPEDLRIALLPGTFTDIDEIQRVYPEIDAIVTDGEVIDVSSKFLTVASKNTKTMEHFKTFSKFVNTEIVRMDIVSDNRENFQKTLDFVETTPFDERPGFTTVSLADSVSPMQNDNHRAIVERRALPVIGPNNPRGLPIYAGSLVVFSIVGNSRLDVSMDVRV